MVLHYSIDFKNGLITHHGEVSYPISAYQNYDKYTDSMTAFVKSDLVDSMRKWGFTPDQIVKAEFYFFRMAEEIIFFEWEKEDAAKLHSTCTQ